MIRLVVASRNPDKVAEIVALLQGLSVAVVTAAEVGDWGDIPETGDTLTDNALLKARAVHRATGLAAVADDTGLEVAALGGAPGVRTGRFAGDDATYADNVAALLAALTGETDRSARFRAVVALVGLGDEIVVEGAVDGAIADAPRGAGGFGYDPVFVPGGEDRTFAEMGATEKAQISHRGRALAALADVVRRRLTE